MYFITAFLKLQLKRTLFLLSSFMLHLFKSDLKISLKVNKTLNFDFFLDIFPLFCYSYYNNLISKGCEEKE